MQELSGRSTPPSLTLVVPCYNEEGALPVTVAKLREKLQALVASGSIAADSSLFFIDDGSGDRTWELIRGYADEDARVGGIKLARNFGHQYALYAGLMEAPGDILISLDADLQDDIAAIDAMVDAYLGGNDIVYGVRDNRERDTVFKRYTAWLHYALLQRLGIDTVADHADFRLMSRRAVGFLSQYKEANLYLRGIVPLLGLPSTVVHYKRLEREAGETKYTLRRMLSLSLHGVTSFSIAPLRFIAGLGMLVFLLASALGGWALYAALFGQQTVPGWASTVVPIYLLGGLQLLAIGVAGEYIGKTFMESKARPRYLIDQHVVPHNAAPKE